MTEKQTEIDLLAVAAPDAPKKTLEALPVRSLRELFDRDDARVEAFKSGLKTEQSSIKVGDFDHVVHVVTRRPALLMKAADLIRTGSSLDPSFRTPLMRLGIKIVQHAGDDLKDWAVNNDRDPALEFVEVTNWAAKLLQNPNKAVGAKAELIICIALIVLLTNRNLKPAIALDAIAKARGITSDGRSDSRPEQEVIQLLRRAKSSNLASYAKIRLLSMLELAEAHSKTDDAIIHRNAERARSDGFLREISALNKKLEEERSKTATADLKIAHLESKMDSNRSLGAHDIGGMRARFRRVVTEEIATGVQDALDSLEMDIPKPGFAIDFLQQIQDSIKRESKWLDVSTG